MNTGQPIPTNPLSFWQSSARVCRLARKELLEIVRDRRTIFTLVLMPLLLYPLLSFAFRQFLQALPSQIDPQKPLVIAVDRLKPGDRGPSQKEDLQWMLLTSQDAELGTVAVVGLLAPSSAPGPLLAASTAPINPVFREPLTAVAPRFGLNRPGSRPVAPIQIVEVDNVLSTLSAGQVDVGVTIYTLYRNDKKRPQMSYVHVIFPEQSLRSRQLVDYLVDHIALANGRLVRQQVGNRVNVSPLRVVRLMVEPDEPGAISTLSLTALVPLILILMTITGAVYPAIDLTAGERERGTLEILVAAPVPRMSLLLAKYIAVVSVAMLTATVNLTMMLITIEFNGLTEEVFKQTGITPRLVVQLLFLLFLFAAFFSAVLLTLTSFARSFKEAQAYLIPLMLASLAPGVIGMMPGLRLAGVLAVTPLVNIVLLARDLSEGPVHVSTVAIVVVSTLMYALAAIAGAARIFGAEAVLYSEQSGWGDLLRRPSAPQATSSVAGAMLCVALLFPGFLTVIGLQQQFGSGPPLRYLVVASMVLFIGLPIIAMLLGRIRFRSALQLWWPPWLAWPAALMLAFASAVLILRLLDGMQSMGLTFLGGEMRQRFVADMWRQWRGYGPDWVDWVAVAFALIGVAEEIFFRGFLFSALRASASKGATIFSSAALFGLFHCVSSIDQLVPSTLMGLLLGWICWNTRSVLPGLVLHAAYNLTLVLLAFHLTVATGVGPRSRLVTHPVPLEMELAAIPLMLIGLALIHWCRVRPSAGTTPGPEGVTLPVRDPLAEPQPVVQGVSNATGQREQS
jgi:sodium transport system permease protein